MSAAPSRAEPSAGAGWRRRAAWRLLPVMGIQLGFLGAILILSACYSADAKLTGFDLLALPGERLALRAKIEHDGPGLINPDIAGVEIEFLAAPPVPAAAGDPPATARDPVAPPPAAAAGIGSSRSDRDGIAELLHEAPRVPGNHPYWARLKEPGRLHPREPVAMFTVSVLESNHPIAITDIDNTIATTTRKELGAILDDEPERIAPLPGAAEVLRDLSRTHRIVYLTARSTYLAHRTRRWLAVHRFPAGPVLLRDVAAEWRSLNLSEGEFKRWLIQEYIRKRWPEVRWGFGNTRNDVTAYGSNKIRGLILGYDPKAIPEGDRHLIQSVADWSEIRKILGL